MAPKRPSIDNDNNGRPTSLSADQIISNLREALSSEQRLAVTRSLLVQLQSNGFVSPLFCDELIHAGITTTLCLHLGLVLNRRDDLGENSEIENICSIIHLIYTGCTASVRDSVTSDKVWLELCQFLILALRRKQAVLPVISILHACSSSRKGSALLFKCRLIRSIADQLPDIINGMINDNDNHSATTELLGLLKNVTNYGEDHCLEMVQLQNPLMVNLSGIPFETGSCKKSLERLSAIIRNLAVSPNTRLLLAQQGNIFGAVARLGNTPNQQIQRNTLSLLLSLCQDMDSCVSISLYGDGVILNLLRQLMMVPNNAATRRRAVRVVRLLAREASGSQVARDPHLIACLSHRSLHDRSNEVRAEATDAIVRLSSFVHVQVSKNHVLPLMHLASSTALLPEVLAIALIKHSVHLINKLPMRERKVLIECLAEISMAASTSNECQELACRAILDLSRDESNRAFMASTSILEALLQNETCPAGGVLRPTTTSVGIKALVFLTTVTDNRKLMAQHHRLVQTLILSAASIDDDETKQDVKKAILALVTEL